MAATCVFLAPVSGGNYLKTCNHFSSKSGAFTKTSLPGLKVEKFGIWINHKLSVRAEYNGCKGGSDAGFLLGGAAFGTLAYIFAPQIRRSLLNEDEYGFKRAKRPIYYDEGLEKTRQTLNEKISKLNSAINNVSTRLRGGNNLPTVQAETNVEEAAL